MATTTRHRRRSRKSPPVGPARSAAAAFLTTSFAPVLLGPSHYHYYGQRLSPPAPERAIAEFRTSLTNLSAAYAFTPTDELDTLPYPLNIVAALETTRQQLKVAAPDLNLFLVSESDHATQTMPRVATLATHLDVPRPYDEMLLPVEPLWVLIHRKDRTRSGRTRLLVAIYAYLYQVAKLAYPLDNSDTWIGMQMEFMREEEDQHLEEMRGVIPEEGDEEEEYERVRPYIKQVDYLMRRVLRRIGSPQALADLPAAIDAFQPKSASDHKLMQLARLFQELRVNYPTHHIDQHIHGIPVYAGTDEEEGPSEDPILPDQLISFVWNYSDRIYESYSMHMQHKFEQADHQADLQSIQVFDLPDAPDRRPQEGKVFLTYLMRELSDLIILIQTIEEETNGTA